MPTIAPALENGYMHLMDAIFAHWPGPKPSTDQLRRCKLISHRGEHDNRSVMENTLAAFDHAAVAGVWGLEMDLRWTRDRVPVISHDANLSRIFHDHRRIDGITFTELRQMVPGVPALSEIIARYGKRLHLMIEIKETLWPDAVSQNRILNHLLAPLQPMVDYHFLALTPAALTALSDVPAQALVPIAYHWPHKLFRQVQVSPWGGMCGHYSLMAAPMIRRLKARGKSVGTGYATSPKSLFRDIRRGIDWIFSNHAAKLQQVIDTLVASG